MLKSALRPFVRISLPEPAGPGFSNAVSSQGYDAETSFTINDPGNEPASFDWTPGDNIIGGNGPDTIVYNIATVGAINDGVDLLWDFNLAPDTGDYDATQGDVLLLQGWGGTVADLEDIAIETVVSDNGNDVASLALVFGPDQAIVFFNITDFAQLQDHIVLG